MGAGKVHSASSQFLVKAYKGLGVIILFLVLFGLVGYLINSAFYLFTDTWARPHLIQPSDPDVLRIKKELQGLEQEKQELKTQENKLLAELAAPDSEGISKSSLPALRKKKMELEQSITLLKNTPYYEALQEEVGVLFVPYENEERAMPGTDIFECALRTIFCTKVGTVGEKVMGEVSKPHPRDSRDVRGFFVKLELDKRSSIKSQILFLDKKPFWIL